jgi:hypothetical protein
MPGMSKILFIGDIVGRPGRRAVQRLLPGLREQLALDLVIANGENAAAGAGITAVIAEELRAAGIDAITLGDHCWDQRGFDREIGAIEYLCRPANLPPQCPGRTSLVIERNGLRLGICTVLGRQFMKIHAADPFACALEQVQALRGACDALIVEIHAEATSEKVALGWYLDGEVAAVLGTHTHIPTADARVLPGGTAYITDLGMTGPYASVLGRDTRAVVARFLDGMPRKFDVAEGDVRLCGALLDIDPATGAATAIERVEVPLTES